jgi:hypothetical protein
MAEQIESEPRNPDRCANRVAAIVTDAIEPLASRCSTERLTFSRAQEIGVLQSDSFPVSESLSCFPEFFSFFCAGKEHQGGEESGEAV